MSHFTFPSNPVDGQQVSHPQPDGTVLTAVYKASRGSWELLRQMPASTPVQSDHPIHVTPTADRQVITWDAHLQTWIAAAPVRQRLQELEDVDVQSTPALGSVPTWSYQPNDYNSAQWKWEAPTAHVRAWDATTYWAEGATVFHRGHLWRSAQANQNVEPALEAGKVTLFIHADGEPSFGIVPAVIDAAAPPTAVQVAGPINYAYWLQYVDDGNMTVWKFVHQGLDQAGFPIGQWEVKSWTCIPWRRRVAPPANMPKDMVNVWINDAQGGSTTPVIGQDAWAPFDLTVSIGMAADVDAPSPKNHDLLVYDETEHKWKCMSKADFLALP